MLRSYLLGQECVVCSKNDEVGIRLGVGRQKTEVGSRKAEVGRQKSEVGSRKMEDGRQKTKGRRRKAEVGRRKGSRKSEVGRQKSGVALTVTHFLANSE